MTFLPQLIGILLLQAIYIMIPGAGFALVARISEVKGTKAGIQVALGSVVSKLIICAGAFLGLDLVLSSFPHLIKASYVIGALWLLWQAVLTLRAIPKAKKYSKQKKHSPHLTPFTMGLLQTLINIESVFFYTAIITQFRAINVPTLWQYAAILEMCAFTVAWCALVAVTIRHIPHHHKILTHIGTRSVLAALFVLAAGGLLMGLR